MNTQEIKNRLHTLLEEFNGVNNISDDDIQPLEEKQNTKHNQPSEDRLEQKKEKTEENPNYSMLKNVLSGDLINNAALAYKIFPDLDSATARSLFRKKLHQKPSSDESGLNYSFTKDELKQALGILRNLATKIAKK